MYTCWRIGNDRMKYARNIQTGRPGGVDNAGALCLFFLWWTIFAFGLGSGDPEEYSYVFGLPAWFFYSCVLGYPVMALILWVVVRCFFADIPLDETEKSDEEEKNV